MPRRRGLSCHPGAQAAPQQPEMFAVQLGRVGTQQGCRMNRADHRLAVVLVQARPRKADVGRVARAFDDLPPGLRVAFERAGDDRVERNAARGEPLAQSPALPAAEFAQHIVVGRAERGLTMANQIEMSHAVHSRPRTMPEPVAPASAGPLLRWKTDQGCTPRLCCARSKSACRCWRWNNSWSRVTCCCNCRSCTRFCCCRICC